MAETGIAAVEAPVVSQVKTSKETVKPKTSVKAGEITVSPPKKVHKKTSTATSTKSNKLPEIAHFPDAITGSIIHAWRTSMNETQAVFADRLGISSACISQWEKKGNHAIGIQARTLSALRRAWEMTH